MSAYGKSPLVDFTRASKKWVWNSAGLLEEIAVDALPWNYDPATGDFLGLLIEKQATNDLIDCRDPTTGNWNRSNVNISSGETGLDGTASAHDVGDSSGANIGDLNQTITIADNSQTHAVRFVVGKDEDETRFPAFDLFCSGGTLIGQGLVFNTKTGEITARFRTAGDDKVEDWGDFWAVELSVPNNGSGNTTLTYKIRPAWNSDGSASADDSATGSFIYDFGQVELNTSLEGLTSPIETAGSAVTRSVDNVTSTIGDEFNADAVTLVFEGIWSGDTLTVLAQWDDGSNSNALALRPSGSQLDAAVFQGGGSAAASVNLGAMTAGEAFKVAVAFEAAGIRGSLNGGAVQSSSSFTMPTGLTTRNIGGRSSDGRRWNGHVKFNKELPRAVLDAELQSESAL